MASTQNITDANTIVSDTCAHRQALQGRHHSYLGCHWSRLLFEEKCPAHFRLGLQIENPYFLSGRGSVALVLCSGGRRMKLDEGNPVFLVLKITNMHKWLINAVSVYRMRVTIFRHRPRRPLLCWMVECRLVSLYPISVPILSLIVYLYLIT